MGQIWQNCAGIYNNLVKTDISTQIELQKATKALISKSINHVRAMYQNCKKVKCKMQNAKMEIKLQCY